MDALLVLVAASLLCFAGMIISEKKRGLGFFSVVLSTCALCGIAKDATALGDDFVLLLVPMLFVMLMSFVTVIRVGTE